MLGQNITNRGLPRLLLLKLIVWSAARALTPATSSPRSSLPRKFMPETKCRRGGTFKARRR
jgi:hypothetical protein